MASSFHMPADVAGPERAGIFPTYDVEARELSARTPMKSPRPAVPSAAAAREAAELVRIARAEEAWREQVAIDTVEEASMESFPCSDPPGYYATHA